MGPFGAALIQGGTSLIGGLFQGHAQRKAAKDLNRQNNRVNRVNREQINLKNAADTKWRNEAMARARKAARHPVNIKQMMSDAEKAGFNPVTWLNAGAMQMYGQKVDVEMANLDNPATGLWQRSGPVGSTASYGPGMAIGDAIQAAGNTFLAAQQQIDQNNFEREMTMMKIAAANVPSHNAGGRSLGGVPSYRSTAATADNGYLTVTPNSGGGGYLTYRGSLTGGSGVGSTATMQTSMGPLYNPHKLNSDAYEGVGGAVLGPILEAGEVAVNMLNDPRNKPWLTKWYTDAKRAAQSTGETWMEIEFGQDWNDPIAQLKRTRIIPGSPIDKAIKYKRSQNAGDYVGGLVPRAKPVYIPDFLPRY